MCEAPWTIMIKEATELYRNGSIEDYDRIVELVDLAIDNGLNVFCNPTEFFDAVRLAAAISFEYHDYKLVTHYLYPLIHGETKLPDWVYLYYSSAMIHSSALKARAKRPDKLFYYLDYISDKESKYIDKRNSIYKEFLNLIVDGYCEGKIEEIAIEQIVNKGLGYRLNNSKSLLDFADFFGCTVHIPPIDILPSKESEEEILRLKALVSKLNLELQEKNATIEVLVKENVDLQSSSDQDLPEEIETVIEKQAVVENKTSERLPDGRSLLRNNQQILVLGATKVKEKHLQGIAGEYGFDKDQLEYVLDYDEAKDYTERIKPFGSHYVGIIVGPMPHKTSGLEGYSSTIEMMKNEEGYPHIIEAKDESNTLKLSKSSFNTALKNMIIYLQTVSY